MLVNRYGRFTENVSHTAMQPLPIRTSRCAGMDLMGGVFYAFSLKSITNRNHSP